MEKRYVAVIDFYVWAESDEEATKKVRDLCKIQDAKNDDKCSLIELAEQPFGTLSSRKVYIDKIPHT